MYDLRWNGWSWMRRIALGLSATLLVAGLAPASGAAEDAVEDILGVLYEKGLIGADQREEILAKHASSLARKKDALPSLLSGLEFSGDFRFRFESMEFDTDALGNERTDRTRLRYRLRLGVKKQLNENLTIGVRIASGGADPRSTNQTLGAGPDFDTDPLQLDRAYIEYRFPKTRFGLRNKLVAGKTANPFMWKMGLDLLVWDSDINLEGISLQSGLDVMENAWLFANAGYYVAEERSLGSDPKLFALQLGGGVRVTEELEVGMRVSGYEWRSLEQSVSTPDPADFINRASAGGNLANAFDSKARIGESSLYLRYSGSPNWPLVVFGTGVMNFTADDAVISGFRVDEENMAFGGGFEIGDPRRIFKVGIGFYEVEANAVLGQFTDSDLFNGFTNAKGYIFYASRTITDRVQFRLTYYDSDSLRNRGGANGPFAASLADQDRKMLRTDLVVDF